MSSPTCTIGAPPRRHVPATPRPPAPPTFARALCRLFAGLVLLR